MQNKLLTTINKMQNLHLQTPKFRFATFYREIYMYKLFLTCNHIFCSDCAISFYIRNQCEICKKEVENISLI